MAKKKKSSLRQPGRVTLREVAERVGLAPGTVSAILNDAPSARAIPEHTRQRMQAAALENSIGEIQSEDSRSSKG